jgi:vanillate O-demethylase monooxygenase subunit
MPFLRNAWYIAAWADEIADGPLGRVLLGQPVVLFRQADGAPVALEDRCCHRSLPLSMGRVIGDRIQCGYHGLEFDRTGACVKVPGQSAIPPGAEIRSYPAVERHRWIWVWMGEAERADPAQIPDFHWLDDPNWVAPTGTFHLEADYQRLVDNLLDFSHVQFVHARTIGTDAVADNESKVRRDGNAIEIDRWILDRPPPPLFARAGGFDGNVDRWMNCRFTPPSSVVFDIGCARAGTGALDGDRSQGIEIRSLHGITPETPTTAHYFWGYARNFALDDSDLTEVLRQGAHATFEEDVEILAHQQRAIDHQPDASTIDINGDAGALLARRITRELAAAEDRA